MTKEIILGRITEDISKADLIKLFVAIPNKYKSKKSIIERVKEIKSIEKSKDELAKMIEELFDSEEVEQLKTPIIEPAPGVKYKKIPTKYKKGDVLMHPIFRHPYVLLEYKNNKWICCLLTSEPNCSEILEKSKSRFFENEFFTRVLFTENEPVGSYMYPFDNTKQVNSILLKLKEIFI
jgi:hypothetical protein